MKNMIDFFWKICIFKLKPQDLPASSFLMLLSTLAYVFVGILVGLVNLTPGAAFLSVLLETAIIGAMTQMLLWIRELAPRFQQTFTALMGAGAILGLLALPVLFMQVQFESQGAGLLSFLILALVLWNLAIVGHILRHAISSPFYVGALLSVLFMYVSISVLRSLFTPAG